MILCRAQILFFKYYVSKIFKNITKEEKDVGLGKTKLPGGVGGGSWMIHDLESI